MRRVVSLQSLLRRHTSLSSFFLIAALAPLGFIPAAVNAHAQFGAPDTTTVHDASALKPPPGARVAIIEFEDMQCPDCARANPMLKDAAASYNIPWVRHDFPLPQHNWSFQAAVNARFFDTVSKTLGNDYRDDIFLNQPAIETPADLEQFTSRFASKHGVTLPSPVDPTGSFAELVKADRALGQRIGIEHTPTIWIVTNSSHAPPFIEVVDRSHLYQLIDQAMAETQH
ncbi:MAG TPA: thioredoxin domain-containing protein [Terracidiphilus sp.]|nr:thioredoxin domain-containing protein [Terracidiphilus sp.]